MHVEQQIHLRDLGHIALHVEGALVGIESGGKILGEYVLHALVQLARIGIGGQRMKVGYEETAIIVILHSQEFAEGAEVVAQMKVAGGADSAHHDLFFLARLPGG